MVIFIALGPYDILEESKNNRLKHPAKVDIPVSVSQVSFFANEDNVCGAFDGW